MIRDKSWKRDTLGHLWVEPKPRGPPFSKRKMEGRDSYSKYKKLKEFHKNHELVKDERGIKRWTLKGGEEE
tara:strand:+ start:209 stop:421 length:213 start_codon:yes stop_codon:yes gene_type:complete